MRSVAEFKKAFKSYMAKPGEEQNATIVAALKDEEARRQSVLTANEGMKTRMKELVSQNRPLSEGAIARGKELEVTLKSVYATGDYSATAEILEEIEALVTDDLGVSEGALKALLERRVAASDRVDTALNPVATEESTDTPETDSVPVDFDAEFPKLKELMEKRGDAVEWQQEEIAMVNTATDELKRLNGVWTGLLDGIRDKREAVGTAREGVEELEEEIQSLIGDVRDSEENKAFAEDKLSTDPGKWQPIIDGHIRDITENTRERERKELELPARVQAVEDARRELTAEVKKASKSLAAAADELKKNAGTISTKSGPGMAVKNGKALLVLAGVKLVPTLDTAALADPDADISGDAVSIDHIFRELTLMANKHGTGRHGVQTGLERQAGRTVSRFTPDQPGAEGGLGMSLFSDDAYDEPVAIEGGPRLEGTGTASCFVSPESEKQAVDEAIRLVTAQCGWTEIEENGTWKPIDNILVRLGKQKSPDQRGWGVAVSRVATDATDDVDAVKKKLEDFRRGKSSLDALLKDLGATVATDFVNGVSIALNRVGGKWINTSQWPSDVGSLKTADWSIAGNKVRVDASAADEVCPALTP